MLLVLKGNAQLPNNKVNKLTADRRLFQPKHELNLENNVVLRSWDQKIDNLKNQA